MSERNPLPLPERHYVTAETAERIQVAWTVDPRDAVIAAARALVDTVAMLAAYGPLDATLYRDVLACRNALVALDRDATR